MLTNTECFVKAEVQVKAEEYNKQVISDLP